MGLWIVAIAPIVILAVTIAVVTIRARRRARARQPVREPSAFVLLDANDWSACTVDDRHEPWHKLTTEPVRGFCGVPVGRHRIVTSTGAGDAVLDLVAYPGEVLAFRLDPERARWEPYDVDAETRSVLEGTPASSTDVASARKVRLPGWLVHLRTAMGGAVRAAQAEDDGLDRLRKRFSKLVAAADRASLDAPDDDLLREARALGETLVGRPVARRDIRALVAPARDTASRLLANGDTDRAMRVVGLGLALMPGDPELMVVAGCVLAVRGETDDALRALEAALERDRHLDASDVARAMRARMELRSRLGRSSVRV